MVSVPVLLVAGTAAYWLTTRHIVSTDNAYVRQDKVTVSAEVSGPVREVYVVEGQIVKAGEPLFQIDPEPFEIALLKASADMAKAQVDAGALGSDVRASEVDIAAAREDVAFALTTLQRRQALLAKGFSTKALVEAASHDVEQARDRLARALAGAQQARSKLATIPEFADEIPAVASARAERQQAQLNLKRATVVAPVSGRISQVERLLPGQMMLVGMPSVSVVVDDRSWIEANIKETDLAELRPGQRADIKVDAFPDLKLEGIVGTIGAGTGSEFSILPAQNATGNWVKVTQRVPVRIELPTSPERALIAGLSVQVEIDTRGQAE